MVKNIVLLTDTRGNLILGAPTPIGVIPLMTFSSLDELKRFAMGILGYCEYFCPTIPDVYLKAFGEQV